MSNTKTKRDYFEPTTMEASLIAAAAAMTGPNDHDNWEPEFVINLREVTTRTRQWKYRDIVKDLLAEESKPFAAVIRGFAFHENSQRYVVQLETIKDGEPELEYINTNRVDSDPSVDLVIDQIEHELLNRLVLVYKTMEVKGKLKYRSLGHVSDLGPAGASGFSDDDLADELEDHVDSIGKKR